MIAARSARFAERVDELELLEARAAHVATLTPSTWDPVRGTVEAVWTTGAPVLRRLGPNGPEVVEILDLAPTSIRLGKLNSGTAPVLDTHGKLEATAGGPEPTTASVVGVVEKDSVRQLGSGEWMALLRVADTLGTSELRAKVAQSVVCNVSVGARVYRRERVLDEAVVQRARRAVGLDPDSSVPVVRAVDWEPKEVSFVAAGADDDAVTRSANLGDSARNPELNMDETEETETAAAEATTTTESTTAATESEKTAAAATATDSVSSEASESSDDSEETEAAAAAAAPAEAATRSAGLDSRAVYRGFTSDDLFTALAPSGAAGDWTAPDQPGLDQVQALERHRISEIRTACRAAGAGTDLEAELIGNETTEPVPLTRARQRILEHMSQNQMNPRSAVAVTRDENDTRRAGLTNALEHRCRVTSELTEAGRAYRGMSLLRTAEEMLRLDGVRLPDHAPDTILRAVSHGSTDFTALTADVANKALQRGYSSMPTSWQSFSRRRDAPDFKPMNRPRLGGAPRMERLVPGAEIKHGTVSDTAESWTLLTYAKALTLTRQAIINDDTGALDTIPTRMGRQVAELEADIVWSLITSNPVMAEDGTALFHSDHGNLLTGGASALSQTSLSAARTQMRLQKDQDGKTQINVNPRWLITPAALETEAQKQVAAVNPNAPADVNPFQSQFQGVIVEPRLDAASATAWYMAADPELVEVIEYGSLQGATGPVIENRNSWTHDGVEFRGIYDFGAGVLDFRGLHKADGA